MDHRQYRTMTPERTESNEVSSWSEEEIRVGNCKQSSPAELVDNLSSGRLER